MINDPDLLWSPGPEQLEKSNVAQFLRWLEQTRGLRFGDYAELWHWSITDLTGFWSAVWEFYGLDAVSGYEQVLADATMPGAAWFPGARINFAERCLAQATTERPALVSLDESGTAVETSWEELGRQVASVAQALRGMGVETSDCVAGYLPNLPQAVVALLATASSGAVWTVCSPDFGTPSVLARLRQARPKVLVAADGYRWGGKKFDRRGEVAEITAELPTVRHLIAVRNLFPASARLWAAARPELEQHDWSTLPKAEGPAKFARCPSTTRCGSCGPPGPPASPRASSRATAASPSNCSRPSGWAPTYAPRTATCSSPPPAGWCGISSSAACSTAAP
jgi:acetoacetyl-CoA synthetase